MLFNVYNYSNLIIGQVETNSVVEAWSEAGKKYENILDVRSQEVTRYKIKPFVDVYKVTNQTDLINAWDGLQIGYAGINFTENIAVKVIKEYLNVGEKDATNIFYALLEKGIIEPIP